MRAQGRPRAPALGILCSGHGTNVQAIVHACRSGRLKARVAVVLSDRPHAYALVRARRAGVPTSVVEPKGFGSRAACERRMIEVLEAHRVRVVCLAGFMRVLSPAFVRHFAGRILNIHPALLPAFPGAHALRDALAWGAKVTGVTVHLVDEQVDHGPIIAQGAVPIRPRETEGALRVRVHRLEHRLYPQAIGQWLSGRLRVRGRRVVRS